MKTTTSAVASVPFLLALVASAAPIRPNPGHAALPVDLGPPAVVSPATLQVVLRCAECTAQDTPAVGMLWNVTAEAGAPIVTRTVRTRDWASGQFELVDDAGVRAVKGTAVEDGWAVQVPLAHLGLPFRTQVALDGYVAGRGVYWPASDLIVRDTFTLVPVREFLDAHRALDPEQTQECDVLVPKAAGIPVTFFRDGEPRAWLFPSPTDGKDGAWTFQFVVPGGSILERVGTAVTPTDAGSAWSFHVPLEAVLEGTGAPRAENVDVAARTKGLGGDEGAPGLASAPVTVGGRRLDLAACPRVAE